MNARTLLPCLFLLALAALPACSDSQIYGLEADLVVDPDHLDFGSVSVGAVETRSVRLLNAGEASLEILSLALRDGAPSLAFAGTPGRLGPGEETFVTVSFQPGDEGSVSDALVVENTETDAPVEVPITASGADLPPIPGSPDIYANPAGWSFGPVDVGQVFSAAFDVHNGGDGDLVLDSVFLAGDVAFTLSDDGGLPVTIPAGGEPTRLVVDFAPYGVQEFVTDLHVLSNDADTPDLVIPINGEGADVGSDGPVAVCSVSPPTAVQYDQLVWNGTASYDTGGRPIVSYVWTLSTRPSGSAAAMTGSGATRTTTTDLPGSYTGELVVSNDLGQTSAPCTTTAVVSELELGDGPVAVCSVSPTSALPFDTLTWNGASSYDPDGRPIVAWTWTISSFPAGSSAGLTGFGTNRTTVTDLAGTYTSGLVVTNDLGQASPPCYATSEVTPTEDLWIEMYWTHSGDDMDLHLLKPGGSLRTSGDCYYSNCTGGGLDWGASGVTSDNPRLDLDDIPGTGPENINIVAPYSGTYTVVVNDYPGSVYSSSNLTTVNIYVAGALAASFSNNMLGGENWDWFVATIDWPSGTITPF